MGPVKGEIRKLMGERGVEKFTMAPVKREYAFENTKIARGSQWVLKVRYPASAGALPVGLTGKVRRFSCGVLLACLTGKVRGRR